MKVAEPKLSCFGCAPSNLFYLVTSRLGIIFKRFAVVEDQFDPCNGRDVTKCLGDGVTVEIGTDT